MENVAIILLVIGILIVLILRFSTGGEARQLRLSHASLRKDILKTMVQFGERRDEWLIIDTETTGLSESDVIVEIAALSGRGEILLNSRVGLPPRKRIGKKAQAIHGISREDLKGAPQWAKVREKLTHLAAGKSVIAYNSKFDERLLKQTDSRHGVDGVALEWFDIMPIYNSFVGEWDSRRQTLKWQRLPGGDHSAVGDAKAVYRLLRTMGLPD